jgi:hypothetical protein
MKEKLIKDIEEYISTSVHLVENDIEKDGFNLSKINYDGWRDLYLDSIPSADAEHLLERFGTTNKELIYDTLNENIVMFNKIVKWTYEGYEK